MNKKRRPKRNKDHDSIDNDTESNDDYQEPPEPSGYLSMTDDDEDYDYDDDDDEVEPDCTGLFVTDVERFRRWFICPVVGCNHMGEHDARESGDWYCASDFHPTARMKILFNDRLM